MPTARLEQNQIRSLTLSHSLTKLTKRHIPTVFTWSQPRHNSKSSTSLYSS